MIPRICRMFAVALAFTFTTVALAEEPIYIGLDADFSGPMREISLAVQQGVEAATYEINVAGGIGGRPIELLITDHRSNPRRAQDHFADGVDSGIVAMISGAQSTSVLATLEMAQAAEIPIVSAFPGSTGVTENGLTPNPAFRVSAWDLQTNAFLVAQALHNSNGRIALLIENSIWGVSNDAAAQRAVEASETGKIVSKAWFGLGGDGFAEALNTVIAEKPDTILLFGKPAQGIGLLEVLAALPKDQRPAALMHWGVAQGEAFGRVAATFDTLNYGVFQTFNFASAHDPVLVKRLLHVTCELHMICTPDDALTPSPLAQGYDAMHLLALGLGELNDGRAATLFDAMQALPQHSGLIRNYAPAFSETEREALDHDDFILVRYAEGGVPKPVERLILAAR